METIYRWIQRSYGYSGSSDKTDWKQSAYDMIVTGKGDCYSFFALSKLLFERLGIPNIDVKRVRTEEHRGDHYWNMVSVDGGETWYYYDSTPLRHRAGGILPGDGRLPGCLFRGTLELL